MNDNLSDKTYPLTNIAEQGKTLVIESDVHMKLVTENNSNSWIAKPDDKLQYVRWHDSSLYVRLNIDLTPEKNSTGVYPDNVYILKARISDLTEEQKAVIQKFGAYTKAFLPLNRFGFDRLVVTLDELRERDGVTTYNGRFLVTTSTARIRLAAPVAHP